MTPQQRHSDIASLWQNSAQTVAFTGVPPINTESCAPHLFSGVPQVLGEGEEEVDVGSQEGESSAEEDPPLGPRKGSPGQQKVSDFSGEKAETLPSVPGL